MLIQCNFGFSRGLLTYDAKLVDGQVIFTVRGNGFERSITIQKDVARAASFAFQHFIILQHPSQIRLEYRVRDDDTEFLIMTVSGSTYFSMMCYNPKKDVFELSTEVDEIDLLLMGQALERAAR